jgi:predicted nucleic acid-binding protein
MGQRFLLDSNTVIDYTSQLLPDTATTSIDNIVDEAFIISIVVKIEVLGFNGQPGKMKKLERFLQLATIVPLNDDIVDKTIELRKKHKKLGLGDAIIAATASVNNYTLITRNIADFKNIYGLKLINPYDL